MASHHILVAGILIPGLLQVTPAIASEAHNPGLSVPGISVEDAFPEPASDADAPFANAKIANDQKLAGVTGRADVNAIEQVVSVRNTSTVSGNIIHGDPITGTISIDGASFGNFSGLALLNANTGNNVSINAAMNVNVAFQQ